MQWLNLHCNEFFSPCFPVERIDPQALRTGAPPARWINAGWAVSSLESGSVPSWRGRGRPPPRRCRRAEVRGAAARPAGSTGQNVGFRGVIAISRNIHNFQRRSHLGPCLNICSALCLKRFFSVKVKVGAFNKEKIIMGVFSKYCEHFAKFRWEL